MKHSSSIRGRYLSSLAQSGLFHGNCIAGSVLSVVAVIVRFWVSTWRVGIAGLSWTVIDSLTFMKDAAAFLDV